MGLLALLLVVGAGVLVVATMRIAGLASGLLAVYVVGFAEVVALSLLLSSSGSLTRTGLLVGTALLFASALGGWIAAGSPSLPRFEAKLVRQISTSPATLVLAVVVALGTAYVVALIVGTPPNGWDPLNYHLARVAFWLQSHRVGYIEPTYDERMNLNPPNGEIGSAFALGVTHQEVLVGFVQLFAALACAAAVAGLARRLGSSVTEAPFAALLFLSLPIVVLQESLSKNDLVVASFLLAAALFTLTNRRRELVLAALATALAVGTKTTALYGVVVLLAVALVARPLARRAERVAAIAAGAVAGSYWYVVNLVETHHFFGEQSAQRGITAVLKLRSDLVTAVGMAVDTLDLSGARGEDILLYLIAGLVVVLVLVRFARSDVKQALVAAAILASPFLLLELSTRVGRPTLERLYSAINDPRGYIAMGSAAASPTIASDTASWFGPIGFLLVTAVAVVAVRSKPREPLTLVFALAPFGWFLLLGLTLSYNPFLGRFFIFPVALSAALWGRALREPMLAAALVGLAVISVVLTLVHYAEKPSGLRLFDRDPTASVWTMPRWEVQSQHDPPLASVLHFLDERVAAHASIALALSDNDFGYPAFGPRLSRDVKSFPPATMETTPAPSGSTRAVSGQPRSTALVGRRSFSLPKEASTGAA
jgi:4-amino-4-deoxy-L-arabinose transferase-like glycosyltransferase